jgi:hypothetical protein
MQDKRRTRIRILSLVIFTLILVYIASAWLLPTFSRYIKRTQDEIKAHYTALYFASTGEGKTIAVEDGVGYIDFDLRNYINENVTQRDIVYTITKPTEFYDNNGNLILNTHGKKHDIESIDLTSGKIPGPRMIIIRKKIKTGKMNKKTYTLFIMGKSKKHGVRILHITNVTLNNHKTNDVVSYRIVF